MYVSERVGGWVRPESRSFGRWGGKSGPPPPLPPRATAKGRARSIVRLPNLISVKCHDTQTERPTDFLTQGPALLLPSAHTVCAGNNIGDAGATAIADALKTNTRFALLLLNGMFCVCALWTPTPLPRQKGNAPQLFTARLFWCDHEALHNSAVTKAFLFFCGASVGAVVRQMAWCPHQLSCSFRDMPPTRQQLWFSQRHCTPSPRLMCCRTWSFSCGARAR